MDRKLIELTDIKEIVIQIYFYVLMWYNWFNPKTVVENILVFSIWIINILLCLCVVNSVLIKKLSVKKLSWFGKISGNCMIVVMTVYCVWLGWYITAFVYLFCVLHLHILLKHSDKIVEE